MMQKVNYNDACSEINANPAPIIFLDTCIFLDIVRSPIRDEIKLNTVSIAAKLLEMASSCPRQIWLVTSETVEKEWFSNIEQVKSETEKSIRNLQSKRERLLSVANSLTNIDYEYGQVETSINLAESLMGASKSLLDACVVIIPEREHSAKAMDRVKENIPPASRGKAEPKDCEIFEVFVSLCGDIERDNTVDELVFSTSNTHEYGKNNKDAIARELNALKAKCAYDLLHAKAIIDGNA
jgi:hypothetical protein